MENKFQKIKMKDIPETHDSAAILNSNLKNICEAIYHRDNYFIGSLEKIDNKVSAIEKKLNTIDNKIDNLTTQLNENSKLFHSGVSSLNEKIGAFEERANTTDKKIDSLENTMGDVKSAMRVMLDHLGLDKEQKILKG